MRWALAALAFGLLVGLAIATVSTRAANLKLRLKLKELDQHAEAYGIECQRWEEWWRHEASDKRLAQRLRQWLRQTAAQ